MSLPELESLSLQPRQRRIRDFLPATVDRERMTAVRKYLILGHTRRLAIQLVRGARHDFRNRVILSASGDEQWTALRLRVHLRRGIRQEVRKRRFEQRPSGCRDMVFRVQL